MADVNQIRRDIERVLAETIDALIDEYLSLYPVDAEVAHGVLAGFAAWLKREVGCEEETGAGPAEVRDEPRREPE